MSAETTTRAPNAHSEIIEKRRQTSLVTLQIHAYAWSEPTSGHFASATTGLFDIALDRRPRSGRGRYLGNGGPEQPLGEIFCVPRGVTMEARVDPCHTRSLRCQIRTEQLALAAEIEECVPPAGEALRLGNVEVRNGLHLLLREIVTPSFGSALLIDALATSAFVEAQRHLSGRPAKDSPAATITAWQRRVIDERLAEPLPPPGLAELARICGLSSRHLTRLFRRATGETLGNYVARAQIRRAKEMLLRDDVALKQIAHQVGFSNASSFARAFQADVGLSPATYRREFRSARH